MTLNQRLKEFIEYKNISAPVFYKNIGVKRNIWSSWMNDGKAINADHIKTILLEYPDIDARWFLTGEGEMLTASVENEKTQYPENDKKQLAEDPYNCPRCEEKQDRIDKLTRDLLDAKDELIAILKGDQKNINANCG